MQTSAAPVVKDIVLVGGGHAHVFVLKQFAMAPIPGVRLTLISPDADTPYSGMLPGLIAGHYTFDEAHIDLVRLCQLCGCRFFQDTVIGLDTAAKKVACADRPAVSYDLLSIDIGSTPAPSRTPGAAEHVIPVKPVAEFLGAWADLKDRVRAHPDMRIGVIGGGAGGVELTLSVQHALSTMLRETGADAQPDFHIVTSGAEILPTHNAGARKIFARVLDERRVTVHTDFHVDQVTKGAVHNGAEALAFDEILWVIGAEPAAWVRQSGLESDDRGFMKIDDHLRSTSHPDVFGAGDIATVVGAPRPKAGVFAVRQGPPLADNLRWAIRNRPLRRYRPQRAFLSLISTGDAYAVASRGSWSLEGAWVWRWKDWIDRRFMAKFNDLPEMTSSGAEAGLRREDDLVTAEELASLGDLHMRCGGCGAKVGASVLSHALSDLKPAANANVLIGLDAPDDAAVTTVPAGKALVETVDTFRAMVDDPYVFGRIAATHCLGDLYAMGAKPFTAMAIATLPVALPSKTRDLLAEMMAGANAVLTDAGCSLIGGHTGEGQELSLGFAMTGLIDPKDITRKAGFREGDVLILTKPLGTGVLFAANMRGKAKGRWITAAIRSACQSNAVAADIIHAHDASAVTDVTGFGLAGHLAEMLTPTPGLGGQITLSAVPMLDGAVEMAKAGIASSLAPTNLSAVRDILGGEGSEEERFADDPRVALLSDPQTAGGLLAGIPAEHADACLEALRSAGYAGAQRIGSVVGRELADPVIVVRQ